MKSGKTTNLTSGRTQMKIAPFLILIATICLPGCGKDDVETVADREILKGIPKEVRSNKPVPLPSVEDRLLLKASEAFKTRHHNTSMIMEVSPSNPKPLIEMARMYRDTAFQRLMERNERDFLDMIRESAKFARKAIATDGNIERFKLELGDIFYGEACALSRKNLAEDAMISLTQAINLGFRNLRLIDSDISLKAVRELDEFKDKRPEFVAKINMRVIDDAIADLQRGDIFPFSLELIDLDDDIIRLSDYQGKVVMVDLHSSMSQLSRVRLADFVSLQESMGPTGLQILGVNYEVGKDDAQAAAARKLIKDKKINYPCALGNKEVKAQIPKFGLLPTTVILDREGQVRLKVEGARPKLYYQTVVELLLGEDYQAPSTTSN